MVVYKKKGVFLNSQPELLLWKPFPKSVHGKHLCQRAILKGLSIVDVLLGHFWNFRNNFSYEHP